MGNVVIFKGSNAKFLKENLEFTDLLIKNGNFSASNNQGSAANVTGLNFSGYQGGKVVLTVFIDATTDLEETFELDVNKKGSDYQLSISSIGDDSNINFSITSGGQIQYTSGNESGFVSSTFKFKASLLGV